jgi:hypothetical protein
MKLKNPIVSTDGLELKEFDYIDIGAILDTSGAVPVVIKSLVFPTSEVSAGTGRRSARSRPSPPPRNNSAQTKAAFVLYCTTARRIAA